MRLLAPLSGVALIAFLVGCGGGGTGDGTTGTTNGGTGTTGSRAPAGIYAATLAGTRTTGEPVTGSGTATVTSDGTITMSYNAIIGAVTTPRTLTAAVTTAGVATGTVVEGGTSYPLTDGNLVRNSNGTYALSATLTKTAGGLTLVETNTFSLKATRPAAGTFLGSVTGTDNKGATYSGAGTLTLPESGNFTLTYSSRRRFGGVTVIQAHTLSTALGTDGTFTGAMTVATFPVGVTVPVTGTWAINANGSLTLTLNYDNSTYVPTPTVSETLTLARQ
ncbi:hypothetical protein EON82_06220 [bacterium]|nr:MAG: hypothetical protein EON82_06220 [bacterium]